MKLLTFGKVVLLSSLLTTFSATAQDETSPHAQDNTQTESDTGIKVEKPDAVEDLQEGDAVYVSEMANVWLRTCPSSNCRIVGATHVGDKYSFVKVSPDKKFTLVDNGQKQLWMQTRDLQIEPCGKAKVDLLEGEIANLNNRLENYDSEVAHNYQVAKAKLENRSIDTDLVTKKFQEVINNRFNNEDFCNLLACSGFTTISFPTLSYPNIFPVP